MSKSTRKLVTIIGGSGFVGRHLVQELASAGYRIRVGVRRPDLAGYLQPLGSVGQIIPVQANVRYPDSIASACHGADIVINLTGILYETGSQSFEAIHEFGAGACARAAKEAGANTYLQLSALGATQDAESAYASSKFQGELNAKKHFPGAIFVRPSIVFGPKDSFFNKFAEMARFSMALPLIGGGTTKFQPLYVGDLAKAISTLIANQEFEGKTVLLGGKEIFNFKQLLKYILKTTNRKRMLIPVPWFVAKPLGSMLGLLPKPPLTRDQVVLLQKDNTIESYQHDANMIYLDDLGITAQTISAVVPSYLYRYRKHGQFTEAGSSSI